MRPRSTFDSKGNEETVRVRTKGTYAKSMRYIYNWYKFHVKWISTLYRKSWRLLGVHKLSLSNMKNQLTPLSVPCISRIPETQRKKNHLWKSTTRTRGPLIRWVLKNWSTSEFSSLTKKNKKKKKIKNKPIKHNIHIWNTYELKGISGLLYVVPSVHLRFTIEWLEVTIKGTDEISYSIVWKVFRKSEYRICLLRIFVRN